MRLRVGTIATFGGAVVLSLGLWTARSAAQAVAPIGPPVDVMAQLLKEVQALRGEVRDAAGISLQSQLLVARLQLQEQRLLHLDRQRAEAASKLTTAEQAREAFAAQLKQFDNYVPGPDEPPVEEVKQMMAGVRRQAERQQAIADALRLDLTSIDNSISQEQARWSEFNARLDELEARLSKRP